MGMIKLVLAVYSLDVLIIVELVLLAVGGLCFLVGSALSDRKNLKPTQFVRIFWAWLGHDNNVWKDPRDNFFLRGKRNYCKRELLGPCSPHVVKLIFNFVFIFSLIKKDLLGIHKKKLGLFYFLPK